MRLGRHRRVRSCPLGSRAHARKLASESAEERSENDVTHSSLSERARVPEKGRDTLLASSRVIAVDDVIERPQADVLDQSQDERQPPCVGARSSANPLVGEAEQGAVACMNRKAHESPAGAARDRLAQQGHVGVVAAEQSLVERLCESPGRRRYRSGGGRASPAHVINLSVLATDRDRRRVITGSDSPAAPTPKHRLRPWADSRP
jgi:hypothetical protein